MKILVQQQLGDKSNYDSSLHDLNSHLDPKNGPGGTEYKGTPKGEHQYEPLENLIRQALNYDSTCYKEALGIDINSKEPNGVIKSQEFSKLKKL